jgi:hypothetical protein
MLFSPIGKTGVSVVGGTLGLISVQGFVPFYAAVTSVGFSQDAGVQFLQSLARVVHVYSFGERMGRIMIHGVAFMRPCAQSKNPFGVLSTGINEVFRFYRENSVTNRNRPIGITLGQGNTLQGFLISVQSSFQAPEEGRIGFVMTFASLPDLWN